MKAEHNPLLLPFASPGNYVFLPRPAARQGVIPQLGDTILTSRSGSKVNPMAVAYGGEKPAGINLREGKLGQTSGPSGEPAWPYPLGWETWSQQNTDGKEPMYSGGFAETIKAAV